MLEVTWNKAIFIDFSSHSNVRYVSYHMSYVHLQKYICDHYSRAETIQGRKLLIIRRFWPRKLFKGGNYSRAETIRGNTVDCCISCNKVGFEISLIQLDFFLPFNQVFCLLKIDLIFLCSFINYIHMKIENKYSNCVL